MDIGTSSLKTVAIDEDGNILAKASKNYDLIKNNAPKAGEQLPEDWFESAVYTMRKIIDKVGHTDFRGLSFSGQTHGIVCLDKDKKPLRPAIIWTDGRGEELISQMEEILGQGEFSAITQNRPFSGYGIISLFWLKKREPETFERIAYVLSPKDYIRFRITGEIGMDYSDATGICCLNVQQKALSQPMFEKLTIPTEIFPATMGESSDFAGEVCAEFAELTNLPSGTPVFYGGADSCMQSVGNGVVDPGTITISLGTSGQVATIIKSPQNEDRFRATLLYLGMPERWQIYGATLSAGLSLKWLNKNILHQYSYKEFDELVSTVPAGSRGLIFHPYLIGERTPHMLSSAKAMFWGLTLRHELAHMVRAVLEGVCFSFRECYEILCSLDISADRIIAAGGGAKSPRWMQMLSDVLQMKVYQNANHEEACMGACITAGIGAGVYADYSEAIAKTVRYSEKIYSPDKDNREVYQETFSLYKKVYQTNASLYQ